MKDFIKIPNTIVRNSMISPNGKLIYALLSSNRRVGVAFNTLCVSVSNIIFMTKYKYNTNNINIIKSAVEELVSIGSIQIYEDMLLTVERDSSILKANDMFYVKFCDDYVTSEEFVKQFGHAIDHESIGGRLNLFTSIYLDDFISIVGLSVEKVEVGGEKITINRGKFFSTYAMILSRANIDTQNLGKGENVSYESIEKISLYTGVSDSTIRKYIKVLYEMRLIFKVTVSKRNQLKSQNLYSRWRDRSIVINTLDENKSSIGFNYYQLLKIGNIELQSINSAKILKEIYETESYSIDNNWVDENILKKHCLIADTVIY